ncbi:MAG: hypothetical protein ACYCY2_10350 [Acidithiobacillus ferriphilus]
MKAVERKENAVTIEKQDGVCEVNPDPIKQWRKIMKQRKTSLFICKRRERQPDVERASKRMRRQARLAKSVRLPRDAWLPILANAVFQHRLSTLANLLLY